MSEELKKFRARHAAIENALGGASNDAAGVLRERIAGMASSAATGLDQLADDVLEAIEAGHTGTKLSDFLGHPAVKTTVAGVKKIQIDQLNAVNALEAMRGKASSAIPKLEALAADIDADLAKRKEKSKSKTDIEKLGATVDAQIKDLKNLIKTKTIKPYWADPGKEFDDGVNKILAKSKDALKAERDNTMLPRQLDTRILKSSTAKVLGLLKSCTAASDTAVEGAGEGNRDKAMGGLKSAKAELDALTEVVDSYDGITRKFAKDIAISKDKATIDKCMDQMAKAQKVAQAKVKAAVTAIKGATWVPA